MLQREYKQRNPQQYPTVSNTQSYILQNALIQNYLHRKMPYFYMQCAKNVHIELELFSEYMSIPYLILSMTTHIRIKPLISIIMHLGIFLFLNHPVILARNGSVPTLGERSEIIKIGVVHVNVLT